MGTEVITYSRIGKEDIRFGKGTFEVVLADGRKAIINEVDLGAIINDSSLSSPAFPYWYNVKAYGAVGDGTTDDTDAIQRAINDAVTAGGGTIVFPMPSASYNHLALTCAPTSGQVHINFLGLGGAGANGVVLTYIGSGGTALTVTNNTRYTFKNIQMIDGGSGAIGLLLNSLAAGSNHGPAWYENVVLTGFTTDVQIGDTSNKAASELTFANLEVNNATTGILVQGPTSGTSFSSNIRFNGLQASSCGTVLIVAGDPANSNNTVFVNTFAFSGNTLECDFQVPGSFSIRDGITENTVSGQFIKSGSGTATSNSAYVTKVLVDTVFLNYTATPSNFACLFHQPGNYRITNSTIQTGSIQVGGFDGGGGARKSHLIVENSVIGSASAPIAYKASSNTIWSVRMIHVGSADSEAVNTYEDRHYVLDTSGTELAIAKYGAWSASAGGDALNAALGTRVVATADLPAASSDMNGTMLLEDAGAGDRNLIIYAGGERFRIDGGATF